MNQITKADPKSKNSVALDYLLSLQEDEQFREIQIYLERDVALGLSLAGSVLKKKQYFEHLFDLALAKANASDMELWLKYLVPRIGFQRVMKILSKKILNQIYNVDLVLYWLPKFLPKSSEKSSKLLKEILRRKAEMIGGEYKAISTSGQVYKLILKVKDTGEYAVFGGYRLGTNGTKVIVEILSSEDLYPTGGIREVSLQEIEILNPQPYND